MSFATAAKLGAGTKLEYESAPDTWTELVFAKDLPALGAQGSFIDVTPISKTTEEVTPGLQQTQEIEFVLFDVPGDADHQAFFVLANAGSNVDMRITYTTGRIGTATFALNGARVNTPAREEGVTLTVYARQSGAVVWSETA